MSDEWEKKDVCIGYITIVTIEQAHVCTYRGEMRV